MKNQKSSKNSTYFRLAFISLIILYANTSYSVERERIPASGNMLMNENQSKTIFQNNMDGGPSFLIRLGRKHFDSLKVIPAPMPGFRALSTLQPGQPGYYIVQFDGPIKRSWRESLKSAGAVIFDYIPDFAFIVKMGSIQEQAIQGLDHVRWVGDYQPSFKVSLNAQDRVLTKSMNAKDMDSRISLRVTIFPGEDLIRVKRGVTALGGIIADEVVTGWKTTFIVDIGNDQIPDLSSIVGVKWIEPVPEWRLLNNVSTDVMTVRNPRDTNGLYGEGQTVGVCDSGLDRGSINPVNLHDDFEDGAGHSRVVALYDRVEDGADDGISGHGTHVAGSVLGNGILSGSDPTSNSFPSISFAGIAPKADLVFQAVEADSGALSGIPTDLNILFLQANNAGADLHTNSWGGMEGSIYNASSEDVDEYMWDHPGFLILFSAGNSGMDLDGDGIVDGFNIDYPATAKNCLTVGASEGDRPTAGADGFWADFWPNEFSVTPISDDHISDEPAGMTAFSARGPALDGRYKPDLVAPGSNILSARSSTASGTGWGEYNAYYMWMGGTSMATPLVAGAAALLREYLVDERNLVSPSASLIKAALLNSAEDISPGQYGTGGYQEIPDSPVPNNVEGWGRLNLENSVFPTSPYDILYYDGQNPLDTDDYYDYIVNVFDSTNPLKINLAWTDYPGSTVAQGGLVNDLDLQVIDPSGATHYPDNALQKSAVSTLAYDDGSPEYIYYANKIAVKFSPPTPINVESATFYFYNPNESISDVDLVVYDDDGAGYLPGTALFTKTLTYMPSGWITIGITGISITGGDFFIALEMTDATQGILQDNLDNGKSYYDDGSGWVLDVGYTSYIRANIRGVGHSTTFDRVNNVIGLTFNNPATGAYTVRVSGYNVPQGPQSYAFVISGALTAFGYIQFSASAYTVGENDGDVTITVARNGGKAGATDVTYTTSNGTASDVSDYTPASGTLHWEDGEDGAKVFSVDIRDDSKTENHETITLALGNLQGNASLGELNTAVITILDNDSRAPESEPDDGFCFISSLRPIVFCP